MGKATTRLPGGRARQVGHIFFQAVVILVASLGLTALVWWLAHAQANRLAEARFTVAAEDAVTRIVDRLHDYAQILRGGVGLMEVAGVYAIDRAGWRTYVNRMDVERRFPGIQGIGFAPRVDQADLAAYQHGIRAEGFPGHAVNPPGERAVYYPIRFLEPFSGRNLRAFGYDMFSEPVRHAAMVRARDEGVASLTARVTLVQETNTGIQAGTLLYVPLYRAGMDVSTVEGRRRAIEGFVYSPFRMDDLMRGVLGSRLNDLRVVIYDGEAVPENLLFGTPGEGDGALGMRQVIDIFGRLWTIEISPTPAFAASLDSDYPDLVLAAGIIISFLLMWATQSMVSARLRSVALAESNRLLDVARTNADAANLSKSRFLAAASHDIRQPAQSLTLLVGALAAQLEGHPARRLVGPMERALDAMRSLLDGLLDISKLDAGVIEAQPEPVPLGPLLSQVAAEYRPAAEKRGIDLRMLPTSAWGVTDPQLFGRILRNLMDNALRYTETGRILIGCRPKGDAVRVEVWDSGIGIPQDQMDRIFEEFHQVGNPERDRTQGLGLGLAIVRRLALLLGHQIDVRSRLGHGSMFAVELPRLSRPAPGEMPAVAGPRVANPGLVLVIDDEEMVRDGLRVLLEGWGCPVVAADSAESALQVLTHEPPAVILADYRLRGGENGIAAIARIRDTFPGSQIRGVVLTGDTAPERISEATRSGYRILHKPVAAPELRDALAAE